MNETSYAIVNSAAIDREAHAVNHGAILYNKSGKASVRINFDLWELTPSSVIIFFPGDVVKWEMMDNEFVGQIIRYSSDVLRTASINIEHTVYEQLRADRRCGYPALISEVVDSMFRTLHFFFTEEHYAMTDRITTLLLQAFFLGFYDYLRANPRPDNRDRATLRREELFNRFMELLTTEYRKGHEVNYYADRMNISRKYLGIVVRSKMDMPPKRIIDAYIILQLKLALRTSRRSLKQLAHDFTFSDQSALTRYFRDHTGTTPQQYREERAG